MKMRKAYPQTECKCGRTPVFVRWTKSKIKGMYPVRHVLCGPCGKGLARTPMMKG